MQPTVRQLTPLTPRTERMPKPSSAPAPARKRLAFLTWLGAYPVITLILVVLGPAMTSWPLALRTFVVSVLMVVALTWLVMPGLTRVAGRWLVRRA